MSACGMLILLQRSLTSAYKYRDKPMMLERILALYTSGLLEYLSLHHDSEYTPRTATKAHIPFPTDTTHSLRIA